MRENHPLPREEKGRCATAKSDAIDAANIREYRPK
jgi:hypothetical protein